MTDKFIFRFVAGVSIFVFVVVLILNTQDTFRRRRSCPSFTVLFAKAECHIKWHLQCIAVNLAYILSARAI